MAKAGADIDRLPSRADHRRRDRRADRAASSRTVPRSIDEWAQAALAVNPDALVLAHGGPVAEPADAQFILRNTRHCHGFYGASSMERLPTERAMTEQTRSSRRSPSGERPNQGDQDHGRGNLGIADPLADHAGDRRRDRRLSPALALSALDQGDRVRAHRVRRREGRRQRRRLRHSRPARHHAGQHDGDAHRGGAARDAGAHHQEPDARRRDRRVLRQGRLLARGGRLRRADARAGERLQPEGARDLAGRALRLGAADRRGADDARADARAAAGLRPARQDGRRWKGSRRTASNSRASRSSTSTRPISNFSTAPTPSTPRA